jgi:hypothetical protein
MKPDHIPLDDVALGLGIPKNRALQLVQELRIPLTDGFVPIAVIPRLERARRRPRIHAPPIRKNIW